MNTRSTPVRCVGGILHDAACGILLVNRAHAPAAGQWSIPGGRVESGESDQQALIREMHEETGLSVTVRTLAGTVTRGSYEIHDYRCERVNGTARAGDDAADVRWADGRALHELHRNGELTDGLLDALRDWNLLPP